MGVIRACRARTVRAARAADGLDARPFASLTWRFEVSPKRVAAALADGPGSAGGQRDAGWMEGDDKTALKALQARLEAGQRFQITGPPRWGGVEGSQARVPLREVVA